MRQHAYGGIVDDAINQAATQIATQIKIQFIAGVEEYMASDDVQKKISDAKQQVVIRALVTGALTALATYALVKMDR